MQYNVPQFIEVEDRIIGPLTLKQFLILLFGGLVVFFYWSIFETGIIFFILALPTAGLFAFIAFGKFNGRPLFSNAPGLIKYFLTPKYRIFKRTAEVFMKSKPIHGLKEPINRLTAVPEEERVSRLRKLAYFLDQKTAEEERLIHSGKIDKQWLNQI